MTLLSKQQILAGDKKKAVDVPVKEWGGSVRLQEMSASERDAWESESFTTEASTNDAGEEVVTSKFNARNVRARLLVRLIVDEKGQRLFTDDEVASVGSLSASTLQKLFRAGSKLNAISASDIEELEKNFDAAPSGDSSSSSASASA